MQGDAIIDLVIDKHGCPASIGFFEFDDQKNFCKTCDPDREQMRSCWAEWDKIRNMR